eukprot:GHVH01008025.1.p1 GENE.GHVH01008025.1~~GHVH01008025.1.p1  ORF type:complete len:461 (+),score=70.66 GHVH01008025.1:43-1425(+)
MNLEMPGGSADDDDRGPPGNPLGGLAGPQEEIIVAPTEPVPQSEDRDSNNQPAPLSPQMLQRNWSGYEMNFPYAVSPHFFNTMSPHLNSTSSTNFGNLGGGMWGQSTSAMGDQGPNSTRNSATRYLAINPLSPLDTEDPPGFPGIPLDTEVEPLGENGTANGNRSDCPAVGSPDGSNGLTATFDQSHLAYWPPMNHQIQGSFEWNDKMMHSSPTAWSAHSPYPGFFMPSQIRSTPSGQMSAGGLMAYRNSFGHSNDVFFPSSPAAANGAGTMDMNVSNLMMMAGQDTNNNNSNDYHSEQFSPWRNLNSLPNCQPMSNDSSGGVVQFGEKESLSGVAVDLQGKRSQCDDDNSMIDLPSTPPPMTSCPTDDNRGYNIIGSGGQATGPSKSMGSVCHPHDCRPCAFYWTKGCINGHDCRFCHEWHPPKKKKPMKEQKNLMIIARPDGKIEFMRCTVHEAMRVL